MTRARQAIISTDVHNGALLLSLEVDGMLLSQTVGENMRFRQHIAAGAHVARFWVGAGGAGSQLNASVGILASAQVAPRPEHGTGGVHPAALTPHRRSSMSLRFRGRFLSD